MKNVAIYGALLAGLVACGHCDAFAGEVQVLTDIAYKNGGALDQYEKEQCKLDLYLPVGEKGFPTLVWFHGGGLTGGDKKSAEFIARSLAEGGAAVVSAEYRLSPKVKYPAYIEDGAAAFAWTRAHIAEHGGNPGRLFIGGHSAGAYLALMIGLDQHYLRACGIGPEAISGVIPVSGQVMTHNQVRHERGINLYTITADEAAPVYYGRKDTPPMLVLYADHDMPARAEEDAYFVAIMKAAGNERIEGHIIQDRDHGSIAGRISEKDDPARRLILDFINSKTTKP